MRDEKDQEKMKADKHNSREYREHGQVVKVRRGESSAGRETQQVVQVEEGQVRQESHGENDSQERREL